MSFFGTTFGSRSSPLQNFEVHFGPMYPWRVLSGGALDSPPYLSSFHLMTATRPRGEVVGITEDGEAGGTAPLAAKKQKQKLPQSKTVAHFA